MSHDVTIGSAKPAPPPVKFPPTPFFAPQLIRLVPPNGKPFPTPPPASLTFVPVVHNGNILMLIRDVEYHDSLPHPTWKVVNSVLNTDQIVSIVLQSDLQDQIVLTSGGERNTWSSTFFPTELGAWSASPLPLDSSFVSRFNWTFLLVPNDDDPVTVILGFDIFVGPKIGILQQVSSFPAGWTATKFGDSDGIFFTLVSPLSPDGEQEQYDLKGGLFVGALGALVCQGKIAATSLQNAAAPTNPVSFTELVAAPNDGNGEGDGNWTGTSGGP